MNREILNKDVQNFIDDNLNVDPLKVILQGTTFPGVTVQEIGQQIDSKKRSKKKLPSWYNCHNIYYPKRLNIEQSSSEVTAKYKSTLVSGKSLIDITGGFGVDCFHFSNKFKKITHCEIDGYLSEIVSYNFDQMGMKNIVTIPQNGLNYLLDSNITYDWIYVDPSRRNKLDKRVFFLSDCTPDVIENMDLLFKYSDNILIKASPFLDISATLKDLQHTTSVDIVAVNNEVKELLFIVQNKKKSAVKIRTINIVKDKYTTFNSIFRAGEIPTYDLPKKYLYEPNAAILKAGLFNDVSSKLKVSKLHVNSHLYTSEKLIDFPGRQFKILEISTYDKKKLMKLIPSKKANITTRNFPQSVAEIRKKTGIREGGKLYLFFTTDMSNNKIILICEKMATRT